MANPQKLLSPTKHPKGIIAIFRNFLKTTFGNLELLFCFFRTAGRIGVTGGDPKRRGKISKEKRNCDFSQFA
jgi:hypothetical protein